MANRRQCYRDLCVVVYCTKPMAKMQLVSTENIRPGYSRGCSCLQARCQVRTRGGQAKANCRAVGIRKIATRVAKKRAWNSRLLYHEINVVLFG